MKKIYAFVLTSLMLVSQLLFAQNNRNCGTMEYFESQKLQDPGLESRMETMELGIQQWLNQNPEQRNQMVITIPVVFHVVWNTSAQNISDARILAQLDVLNKDFAK